MISDQVVHSLQRSHGWTREFINDLIPYYIATLTHMSKGHATPVFEVVDEIWHAHILCTRDYADFCATRFGCFIHHERFEETSEDTECQGETDFFRDYGLSLRVLKDICTTERSRQQLRPASCGQGEPAKPLPTGGAMLPMPASCGQPAPEPPRAPSPAISSTQSPMRASCGQPDQPESPRSVGRPVAGAV
jgi:hypothetical protein